MVWQILCTVLAASLSAYVGYGRIWLSSTVPYINNCGFAFGTLAASPNIQYTVMRLYKYDDLHSANPIVIFT